MRRQCGSSGAAAASELGDHCAPAEHLPGERRDRVIEKFFRNAHEGHSIANPDAARDVDGDAAVRQELL